jgi:hypothetical protein
LLKLIKEANKTLGPNTIVLLLERRLLFRVELKEAVALWAGEEFICRRELNAITITILLLSNCPTDNCFFDSFLRGPVLKIWIRLHSTSAVKINKLKGPDCFGLNTSFYYT